MSAPPRPAPLLVITGPTASGKTAAALALAQRFDGELIGADSVQVYRGFDIGSSKPSERELAGIAHHLIDVCDPLAELDAADYAALADRAIAETRARGRVPIVVGGSGLWLRALLRGLVALPKVDPALRARLIEEAERLGDAVLHARLRTVDPRAASQIHAHDRVRIVRALEVHAQTGRALGELRAEHALGAPRYDALRVILELPPDTLNERIRARTEAMFQQGFVAEVRGLLERYGTAPRALAAVGYRELVLHLTEGVPLPETMEAVTRATRIYARRQRTWLKNEPGATLRVAPEALLEPPTLEQLARFTARPAADR